MIAGSSQRPGGAVLSSSYLAAPAAQLDSARAAQRLQFRAMHGTARGRAAVTEP
jgi:hypothetical protein